MPGFRVVGYYGGVKEREGIRGRGGGGEWVSLGYVYLLSVTFCFVCDLSFSFLSSVTYTCLFHSLTAPRTDPEFTWRSPFAFNVLVTSYEVALRDVRVLRRKRWYYMILDEVHMVRNWRAKRWEALLGLAEGECLCFAFLAAVMSVWV